MERPDRRIELRRQSIGGKLLLDVGLGPRSERRVYVFVPLRLTHQLGDFIIL